MTRSHAPFCAYAHFPSKSRICLRPAVCGAVPGTACARAHGGTAARPEWHFPVSPDPAAAASVACTHSQGRMRSCSRKAPCTLVGRSIIKFARVNAEKTTKSFTQLTQVHSQASRDPKVIVAGLKGRLRTLVQEASVEGPLRSDEAYMKRLCYCLRAGRTVGRCGTCLWHTGPLPPLSTGPP